ncbi:chemotaxis protein CheY [Microbacterium testaceum]|uniref:Chemotaxis protein CheY n=1 Tax=Microbacterium testaceum TaxID=2033 RepID=A0A147EYF2_MICTE|nr:response regulator transcription factor [Microbacterium testaceum]KTR95002.1 chemotaxis protein CheY [Microbacterium testaceum]
MNGPIRVLVVDDEALLRHALRAFLSADDRVELVGEATDGREALAAYAACAPDVVLMDIKLPRLGGVEATRRLVEQDPGCRVVALTTFTTEWRALEMLKAGAAGYLIKDSTPDQIVDAIVAAHQGDRVVSPEVQRSFVLDSLDDANPRTPSSEALSEREREIVGLIARGLSNAEIAEALHYAESTVKADIRNINRLWRVENRLQVVLRATQLGVVSL